MNKFIIGLTAVVVVAAIVYFAMKKSDVATSPTPEVSASSEVSASAVPSSSVSISPTPMTTYKPATKLSVETLVAGTGEASKKGDTLAVLYTGMLIDGRVFDASSLHGNVPFEMTLGAGGVIEGWQQGLLGAKKGEKRRLIIPPALGYGANGAPGTIIGPNATLIFEVEVKSINGK